MPGVIQPQQKPGTLQQSLGGIQAASSLMSAGKQFMGSGSTTADPGATPPQGDPSGAASIGQYDPNQAARGSAIQRRIQMSQNGGAGGY